MDKREELALCGPVKTVMMLLIVLYHAMANWMEGGWFPEAPAVSCAAIGLAASWLNTVHVPVFVFVSGYLYACLKRWGAARLLIGWA